MILVVRIGSSHAEYGMTTNKVCFVQLVVLLYCGQTKILRQLVTIGNYETLQRIE